MDTTVERLLECNLNLVREYTALAQSVIRQGAVILPPVPASSTPPSFADFQAGEKLSDQEKLFYSEEEEDERYRAALYGAGPETDPDTLKEILDAAGLTPHVVTA